jgi:hypothetical protein
MRDKKSERGGLEIRNAEGEPQLSICFNGGSDGARTRDLRRDRPVALTEKLIFSTIRDTPLLRKRAPKRAQSVTFFVIRSCSSRELLSPRTKGPDHQNFPCQPRPCAGRPRACGGHPGAANRTSAPPYWLGRFRSSRFDPTSAHRVFYFEQMRRRPTSECAMFTPAECRAHAEQKLQQAERNPQHRRRLIKGDSANLMRRSPA